MDCSATSTHNFRKRLGFKQFENHFNKRKISPNKNRENMQTQDNILSYKIDLYFHNYRLGIKTGENG